MRNFALLLTGRSPSALVGGRVSSPGNQLKRSTAEWLFEVLLFSAIYVCVGQIGYSLALVGGHVMLIWPAAGLALAGLWLRGTALWPAVLLGSFLTSFYHTGSPVFSALAAFGDVIGVLVAVTLLERWGFSGRLERSHHVFQLIGVVCLVAAVLGGVFGALAMAQTDAASWERLGAAGYSWGSADALGCLCVAPLLLTWGPHDAGRPALSRQLELLALALAYFAAETIVAREFGRVGAWGFVQAYLPFPFLLCAAVRGGLLVPRSLCLVWQC